MSDSILLDQFLCNPHIKKEDIMDYKELNDYEILIKLRPKGEQIIFNTMNNTIRGCTYRGRLSEDENKKEFKLRLRSWLLFSGLNQKDLADITGISERTLTRYVNGKSLPDYISLKKIADAMNCKVDDLYFNGF